MKNKCEKKPNILILLSTLFSIYLCQSQTKYEKTHNNQIPQVDCCVNTLLEYSNAEQDVVSDETSHSYDCTTSYHTYSVVFKGIKSRICINFSRDDL